MAHRRSIYNYKPKNKKTHRIVLTKEELSRLAGKEFTVERLNLVKDIVIFFCYTGLPRCMKLNLLEVVKSMIAI